MASMLNPAMSEENLVGAMINHYTKWHDLRELKDDSGHLSIFGENADIRIYARAT
jgi:hypothetical protein